MLFEKGISWTTEYSQHCLKMHFGHIKGTDKSSIGRNHFRQVVARGWAKGGIMSDFLMALGFPLRVMKFWMIMMVAQHCECT